MGESLKFSTLVDTAGVQAGMARIEKLGTAAAAKMQGGFKNLLSPIAAIGPAIAGAFAGKAIVSGVSQVFQAGRALQVLSRQTGASAAGLAVLQTKFKQSGLDADGVGTAIFRLQKSIQGLEDEDNKGGSKAVRELGLDVEKLRDMDPARQLMEVGKAMSTIQAPAERTATAMKIFGKSGAELGAVFSADFGNVSPALAAKAQMMAKNAAVFEQVSIKLAKVGGILKTFYVGVADSVGKEMLPYLDRLEKINLVGLGQQFGTVVADGAKMLVGAFQLPETAFMAIQTGLGYAFASAGNVLAASLKVGVEYFQDGMLASLQGIGAAVIATMLRAFDRPIAYLQAGVERALGLTTAKQDLDQVTALRKERDGVADGAKGRPFTAAEQSHLKAVVGQISEIQNKYRNPQTLSERADQIQKEGVRFGMYDGGQTAEEWAQRAREQTKEGFAKAAVAMRGFKVEDLFGASGYGEEFAVNSGKLRQQGQRVLGPGTPASGTPTTGLSKAQQNRLLAQASMALATSRAPVGSDPAAYMFMGRSGMPGTARTNASDPYTLRVDAARVAAMRAGHTIGMGGALDFDPSTRPGWTGAKNAVTRGGLGGAYGATGNIWSQKSGQVSSGDPQKQMVGHLQALNNKMDRYWGNGGGGGSAGGSGATVTG